MALRILILFTSIDWVRGPAPGILHDIHQVDVGCSTTAALVKGGNEFCQQNKLMNKAQQWGIPLPVALYRNDTSSNNLLTPVLRVVFHCFQQGLR